MTVWPCVVVSSHDQVYILEEMGQRKIDRNGIISTIAGTGEEGYNGDGQLAVNAELSYPYGIFVTDEEEVLFCDYLNGRVRKIDQNGIISTIAGNGDIRSIHEDHVLATKTFIDGPTSVFMYKKEIYIAERNRIRKIEKNGRILTIA